MKLSVIIPVYRGKEILIELLTRINETLIGNYDFEVLFICDGCDKTSLSILKEIRKSNLSQIKVYQLAKNYGQHRALQYGFSRASGDLIITIDEDLQHDPADIIKLIKKQMLEDYDIVYGRFANPQHNDIRRILSSVLRKILKHFIPTLFEEYSPYRLIKKDIATRISTMVCPYTFVDDFLSRVTQKIAFVNITHHKRFAGHSSYTFGKLVKHGIFILLAYSRIISYLLATAGLMIFLGSLILIIRKVSPQSIYENLINPSIIIGIFVFGLALIIFSLFGTLINYQNTLRNTRQLELIDEDSF